MLLTASAAVVAAWFYFTADRRPELLISGIGAVLGLTYFLYRQHLDKTKLFKELFVEFNARYAALNEKLNKILFGPNEGVLSAEERDNLFSYFNLCSEEYLFYKAGYFDRDVWESWYRGMKVFFDHPRIGALWEQDCKADSYYGFRPPQQLRGSIATPHIKDLDIRQRTAPTWQSSSRQTTFPEQTFAVSMYFGFAQHASIEWTQQFVEMCLSYDGVKVFANDDGIGFDPNFVFIERVYTEEEGFAASFYGSPTEFAKYGHQLKQGRSESYSRLQVKSPELLQQSIKCMHISANLKGLERHR